MISTIVVILIVILAVVVGIFIGYVYRKSISEKAIGSAEQKAQNLILDAEKQSQNIKKEIVLEAKEYAQNWKNEAEREIKGRRYEVQQAEKRLIQKEEILDKKIESAEDREKQVEKKEEKIAKKEAELEESENKQMKILEKISGLSVEQAKKMLLTNMEKKITHEASLMIKEIKAKAREDADKEAKEIIVGAIQRCAADHVAESTVSVVALPNDDMKGRIIGREGRNIRAIETLTGIELIIDDTPEAVILSGFDPVKREVARIALENLIVDGRIHPSRIEEMVNKAQKEVNVIIKEEGEQAVFDTGMYNLHPELVKLLGRLKYRTSYGQNVLKHSVEVAHLAGLMANELGLDEKLAKRAGLLHDIGKALDHEQDGTHVDIGVEILKKYKESANVINAVAAHHGDVEPKTMEAVLVAAADALSAARPGARRETLDAYIKRLEKLEEIANDTKGVEKAFAIQAGREVRIIANPSEMNDDEIVLLAREISQKIESELQYPGQIKVNVIRETRAIDYAK